MDSRKPIAPQAIVPMIAGAVVGELLVIGGMGWFIWKNLVDSCLDGGGRVVAMACERADGTLVAFRVSLGSPFYLTLIGFAVASAIGTIFVIARAIRRGELVGGEL